MIFCQQQSAPEEEESLSENIPKSQSILNYFKVKAERFVAIGYSQSHGDGVEVAIYPVISDSIGNLAATSITIGYPYVVGGCCATSKGDISFPSQRFPTGRGYDAV